MFKKYARHISWLVILLLCVSGCSSTLPGGETADPHQSYPSYSAQEKAALVEQAHKDAVESMKQFEYGMSLLTYSPSRQRMFFWEPCPISIQNKTADTTTTVFFTVNGVLCPFSMDDLNEEQISQSFDLPMGQAITHWYEAIIPPEILFSTSNQLVFYYAYKTGSDFQPDLDLPSIMVSDTPHDVSGQGSTQNRDETIQKWLAPEDIFVKQKPDYSSTSPEGGYTFLQRPGEPIFNVLGLIQAKPGETVGLQFSTQSAADIVCSTIVFFNDEPLLLYDGKPQIIYRVKKGERVSFPFSVTATDGIEQDRLFTVTTILTGHENIDWVMNNDFLFINKQSCSG